MLNSPNYPNDYPTVLSCEYTVTVPAGYKVLAEFQDFNVERGFDAFYIDGSLITGDSPPDRYISDDETLRIRLLSDLNVPAKGFLLRLSALDNSGTLYGFAFYIIPFFFLRYCFRGYFGQTAVDSILIVVSKVYGLFDNTVCKLAHGDEDTALTHMTPSPLTSALWDMRSIVIRYYKK